ncbi:MAG: sigma-70 family RNA polymerase sigma factor [Edaphocola sp.]
MTKPFYTDTELLEGLATGNREAVAAIYRLYHGVLTKWILTRGGLESDAEDVFQEALVVVYEKAKSPEFCLTCKLSTYLFAISKRIWYRKTEKSAQTVHTDFEEAEEGNLGAALDDDLQMHLDKEAQYEQLGAALGKLGEPCSTLIKAFYVDKRSMQEIAARFGYTNAENAKTQKYKCLTRLRKLFFAGEIKER